MATTNDMGIELQELEPVASAIKERLIKLRVLIDEAIENAAVASWDEEVSLDRRAEILRDLNKVADQLKVKVTRRLAIEAGETREIAQHLQHPVEVRPAV